MRVLIRPPEVPDDPSLPAREPVRGPGRGSSVWLVRHADVHDDWQDRAYGDADVPLSPQGLEQTRALGAAFAGIGIARLASSHLARALRLGEELARSCSVPLRIDARLKEVSRGSWQGLPREEFRARWERDREAFLADPWNWKGHGGESDAEVFARAWAVLAEELEAARGATLVLATHFNVIRVLTTGALGLRASQSFAFRNDPARATLLVDAPEGWRMEAVNAVP